MNRNDVIHDTANANELPVCGGKGKERATISVAFETTDVTATNPVLTPAMAVTSAHAKPSSSKVVLATRSNRSSTADPSLADISNLETLPVSITATIYPNMAGESTQEDPAPQIVGQSKIGQVQDAHKATPAPTFEDNGVFAQLNSFASTFELPALSK